MHPIRRRKKRPNHGVRTIEIMRGKNGFGFTISGQQPCILSCIVDGSPAEKAGLRPGDYLIAVNGQSVSKLPHDEVVRLIGCLNGIVKLQIAENYYSDSSDDDAVAAVRSKPKFIHKPRNGSSNHNLIDNESSKTAKMVKDFQANTIYNKYALAHCVHSTLNSWDFPEHHPLMSKVKNSTDEKEELSFVIGYLGTIEMPKQIQPGRRPQVVRVCIKRLRTEKRSHSWVLMRVHADGVTVAGNGGKVLAEYPVNKIIFCGTSSEGDKKYFGLVTAASGDGNDVSPSSSCHVFAVQANLFEHEKHFSKAISFKVTCTSGTLSQGCFEFPSTSEPILNAIRSFCLTKDDGNRTKRIEEQNEMVLANSPQPSQSGSTAASSNSDSGIGFRDECGNQSDRIVMVDIENQRLHIQQLCSNSKNLSTLQNSLNVQLQTSNKCSTSETSADLKQAFSYDKDMCLLPVSLDSVFASNSSDQQVGFISESKMPTSNRSRSPLLSSLPSSSDDENIKSSTKLAQLKNISFKKNQALSSFSKKGEDLNPGKTLSATGVWFEKPNFHQLELMSNSTFFPKKMKSMCDPNYKMTSKSTENLESPTYCSQKTVFELEENNIAKINSKSTDNLMQIAGSFSDFHSKVSNKFSPQVSFTKITTKLKSNTPLSISYGEGSVIQSNGKLNDYANDENEDILLSYSASPKRLFGQKLENPAGQTTAAFNLAFKSVDDMSICSYKSNDALLKYKLSPKVFGMKRPLVTQSLENLKDSDSTRVSEHRSLELSSKLSHWGSLQNLRSFEKESFDVSLKPSGLKFDEKRSSKKVEGPVAWANSFEKLLEDSAGLYAFTEFLKKEFSEENITFWVSCEKFKSLEDESLRKKLACEIFETHLNTRAVEPVNIDAQAHQYAQEKLSDAPVDLFLPAQKQIFNLMKFDSYPRFLKSDLYKDCLMRDLSSEQMPYEDNMNPTSDFEKLEGNGVGMANTPSGRGKLKKSRSDAEDSSRKPLLPWHKKNRSKSKDRGESEYKLSTFEPLGKGDSEDVVSVRSEITSSRSSLASWDLALRGSFSQQSITSGEASEKENCQLCRVILSDGATTVVRIRSKETVRDLIYRLLEKRGLHYGSFELFVTGSSKPLSLHEDATILSNREIHVEQRIIFRLDMPNRRTVSVKAKPSKTLHQVLKSVLNKYSYKLEAVAICSVSDNEVLDLNIPVTAVDGKRLTVLTRSTDAWKFECKNAQTTNKPLVKTSPTLDEITNKVFEEVLQGKLKINSVNESDQGSFKSEDWGSEHSSGVFSKFLRRDSTYHEKLKGKSRGGTGRQIFEGATKHVEGVMSMVTGKPPLIGKWKSGSKFSGKSESLELYEGLKRAQRNRLDDQRGTEISIELPDFLKDKENSPATGKHTRKCRREDEATTPKFYDMGPPCPVENVQDDSTAASKSGCSKAEKLQPITATTTVKTCQSAKSDIPTFGSKKSENAGRTISKPLTCKTYEMPKTTPIKSSLTMDPFRKSGYYNNGSEMRTLTPEKSEPPPLPPKPKYLPSKPISWNLKNSSNVRDPQDFKNQGNSIHKPGDIKCDNKLARTRRTVYLDQPSSSFV